MPDLAPFGLFLVAAILLAGTPGPGIFCVAARTLAGGRAEGIASSFGTGLGSLLHVLTGALGVSAIVMASAELFTALEWLGALYLVWLGVRTIRDARRDGARAALGAGRSPALGARRAFREDMLGEALNPKTAADVVMAFAAGKVRDSAAEHPDRIRRIRERSGAGMLTLGVALLFARRSAA